MKNKKHTNILSAKDRHKATQNFKFMCRGCTLNQRNQLWNNFVSSNLYDDDNSYIILEEESSNSHDPNAIRVYCKGEFFGVLGYVGKEYTSTVKEILDSSTFYRVDVLDNDEIGSKEISLVIKGISR